MWFMNNYLLTAIKHVTDFKGFLRELLKEFKYDILEQGK